MSTIKADTVTTKSDNTDLTLTGGGTGVPNLEAGFKVGGTAGVPTASIQDDAVTLAKLAAGTDGELITWDASGNPATVAVGTATHVLTSNGAGAAPTFQAGGGAWNTLASGTFSGGTSEEIALTGLAAGPVFFLFTFRAGTAATSQCYFHISDDDGSTYLTAGQSNHLYGQVNSTSYSVQADSSGTFRLFGYNTLPASADSSSIVEFAVSDLYTAGILRYGCWNAAFGGGGTGDANTFFSRGSGLISTSTDGPIDKVKIGTNTGSTVMAGNYAIMQPS
jgi:hypothetical protein